MNDFSDLLFVMGAIVIFGMLLITVNQSMMRNNLVTVGNEEEYTAIALANSIIDEARVTRFDQNASCTIGSLTSAVNLGPETGESYLALGQSNFNDFDDFNGLQLTETTDSGIFTIAAEVFYIERDQPGTPVNHPTHHKRLNVTVSGNTLDSSVRLTYIKSCR